MQLFPDLPDDLIKEIYLKWLDWRDRAKLRFSIAHAAGKFHVTLRKEYDLWLMLMFSEYLVDVKPNQHLISYLQNLRFLS